MTQFRVLAVDDEPLALQRMKRLLKEDSNWEILEATNGTQAGALIRQFKPDLVLLDIQMPDVNGFDVLRTVSGNELPQIIFVTAFEKYALDAFEIHALDYLVKPFTSERFREALEHAKTRITQKQGQGRQILDLLNQIQKAPEYLKHLLIRKEGRTMILRTEEVDWVEADGKNTIVHCGKHTFVLRESLKTLENDLNPSNFVRINRSVILQIRCLKHLEHWFHGDCRVILQDGTQLMLSRRYRDRLERALGRPI